MICQPSLMDLSLKSEVLWIIFGSTSHLIMSVQGRQSEVSNRISRGNPAEKLSSPNSEIDGFVAP